MTDTTRVLIAFHTVEGQTAKIADRTAMPWTRSPTTSLR